MKKTYLLSSIFVALIPATITVGCQDSFEDCENTATCPPEGDGDGDEPTGGANGDGDGDGDIGGEGGGMSTPCDDCPDKCLDDVCVDCLEDGQCTGGDVCDDAGECVACVDADDCNQGSPVCEGGECAGCAGNGDCSDYSNAPVCDDSDGACVQCLTEADCGGKVCHPIDKTCTDLDANTEFACEPCEFDAQCAEGHLCVQMTYDDPTEGEVGTFCLWRRDATGLGAPDGACGLNSRPYAQQIEVTSVDGQQTFVCQPRTTTCVALNQHAATVPGCMTPGDDDGGCGSETFNDGYCRDTGGGPLCTFPCAGTDNRDCPTGFSCVDDAGGDFCGI